MVDKENQESSACEKKIALNIIVAIVAFMVVVALMPSSAFAYTQKEQIVSNGHGALYNETHLVVHETANPGATAENHVNYWHESPYAVHYVMGLDGRIVYHTMSDDRKAWHVGNGNSRSVGIELCHATNSSDFNSQWVEAVKWCGDYLNKRGWGIERMVSHNEARLIWGGTDHTDPVAYFNSFGKSWSQFEAAVQVYMSSGDVPGDSSGGSSDTSDAGNGSAVNRGTYVVTASALNVRTGPGVNYEKKSYSQLSSNAKRYAYSNGCLKQGTRVTVYETKAGFARIPSGWVSAQYLSKADSSSVSAESSGAGNYRVDVSTRLNVRSGPGMGYRITGSLRDGYILHVQSVSNGWAKYQAYSGVRYVSAQYLDAE